MSFLIRALGNRTLGQPLILKHPLKWVQMSQITSRKSTISPIYHKTFQINSSILVPTCQMSHNSTNVKKKENVFTIPNFLCLCRIVAAPYLSYLICQTENFNFALALFAVAGITDLLDGWIARNVKGQASMLGSFLDPLADKILVSSLFLSLTYVDLIPLPLTSLVVSRDVLLVYAGMYIRYMGVTPPFTFKKYFDMSAPTAQVQPTTVSKVNTGFQLGLVATALASPVLGLVGHPVFNGFCLLTAGTTLASSVSYAFQKDCYKFADREYDHQFAKRFSAFVFFILFNSGFAYYYYFYKRKQPQIIIDSSTSKLD